jgi:putative flippase GtrA
MTSWPAGAPLVDRTTRRQIGRFLVAGCTAVGTDTVVYFVLLYAAHWTHNPAKVTSFLAGALAAFVINKTWTFESRRKSVGEVILFLILYTATMFLNMGVNHAVLTWIWDQKVVAFVAATGASTVSNFAGQKWVVFRRTSDV